MNLDDDPLLESVPTRSGFKILGTSILLSEVGRGGFGAVYRAHDAKFDIEVGVKCLLPPDSQWREQSIQRFVREARLAVQLNHQNLVRVFDVGRSGGIEYLVMEFVVGETARERVARKGPLRIEEALSIALGVARGLAAAHQAGIVHRDVKPDNVMVSTRGEVKLADLGLGKALGDLSEATLTAADLAMGTPRYMPPEQWESLSAVGRQGDVWAVGATLYFLLAGQDALHGGTTEILHQVRNEDFPAVAEVRPEVPGPVQDLIRRCTCRDPQQRFADGVELAAALESVFQELGFQPRIAPDSEAGAGTRRTVMVTPPPRQLVHDLRIQVGIEARPTEAEPRSRGRFAALAVLVLVLVGLAVGAWAWFGRDGQDATEPSSASGPGEPTVFPGVRGQPDLEIGVQARPKDEGDPAASSLASSEDPEALEPLAPLLLIPGPFEGFTRSEVNAQNSFEFVHDLTGLTFVFVPGGTFRMGSPASDATSYADERPEHEITLSSFLIAKHELRQEVWDRFMPEQPSPTAQPQLPVHGLSWDDALAFCLRTGLAMPTEAQWEYAARRGEASTRLGTVEDRAWCAANARAAVHAVATRAPDAQGIHDLRGNVMEWCHDVFAAYTCRTATASAERVSLQSLSSQEPQRRVLRGGSWLSNPVGMGIPRRISLPQDESRPETGFRPVWVPPAD